MSIINPESGGKEKKKKKKRKPSFFKKEIHGKEGLNAILIKQFVRQESQK